MTDAFTGLATLDKIHRTSLELLFIYLGVLEPDDYIDEMVIDTQTIELWFEAIKTTPEQYKKKMEQEGMVFEEGE